VRRRDENVSAHAAERQRASNCGDREDEKQRNREPDIRFIAGGTTLIDLNEAQRRAAAKIWSISTGCPSTKSRRLPMAA